MQQATDEAGASKDAFLNLFKQYVKGPVRVFVDDVDEFAEANATHDPELGKRVRSGGLISDWKPLQFSVDGGLLTDYLANSFAFRLCSEKLRGAIESYRVNIDEVQWLPSVVTLPAGHELNYWVLHFPAPPEVLSTSESIFSGARVIKPVLDPNLVTVIASSAFRTTVSASSSPEYSRLQSKRRVARE